MGLHRDRQRSLFDFRGAAAAIVPILVANSSSNSDIRLIAQLSRAGSVWLPCYAPVLV